MARTPFILLVLLSASILLASENSAFSTAESSLELSASRLDISRTSPEYTSISLIDPAIEFTELTVDYQNYSVPVIEGEYFVAEEGSPTVPQIVRFCRIPNTGGVELVIRGAEYETIENFNALPYEERREGFIAAVTKGVVYNRDAWFPEEIATISEPMIFRDFRIVAVTLHPVQVNPVTRQARVYTRIDVDLVANNDTHVNELLSSRPISRDFVPMYRQFISNLDETALDDVSRTPGAYLIIAKDHASVNQFTDSLAIWKKRKGFDVTIEQRTNWSQNQMINYIRDFYENAETPLEFVALMGDPQAPFGVPTGDGGWPNEYDHQFALANTDDDIEDFGVGRLSGETMTQMATIIAKLMAYERDPWMEDTTWYHKGFFYGDVGMGVASNYLLMQWAGRQFEMHTGINDNTVSTSNGGVDDNLVRSMLDGGVSMFIWRGSWLGQMSNALAQTCQTGRRLPVVWTATCGTGNFDYGFSTSESYLVAGTPAEMRGGVCGIGGATSAQHCQWIVPLTGGFVYAIANQQMEHVGNCLNAAKLWVIRMFGPGSANATNSSRWYNLMGDPSLSIWTDVPVVMAATRPDTLAVGARQVTMIVTEEATGEPIEEALVVLWKTGGGIDETYVKGLTDSDGNIVLPVIVDTPGELMLTITKRNHKPYLYDIPCVSLTQSVTIHEFILDDGPGGNDEANPGELIDLNILLHNYGSDSTARNVAALLTSAGEHVLVLDGSASYPDIAPGETAVNPTPFQIQISPVMQHEETALLTLNVMASGVQSQSSFEIICEAGNVEFVSALIEGDDFGPGQTADLELTIRNSGVIPLENTLGHLITDTYFLDVPQNSVWIGTLAPGAEATPNLIEIHANSAAHDGQQASLMLAIETSDDFVDTVYFSLSIGTADTDDPTVPDTYGYLAYDNTDTSYEEAPDFNYLDISDSLGTDLGIDDIGEKTNIAQLWSVVRDLPFTFTFYGVTYEQVTICSNGWLAFGDQGWNDTFRNTPMPAITSASAMVAPYWDDLKTSANGQGVWEYYDEQNHRYLVQWKASGGGMSYNDADLDFEVVIFDEEFYPSIDDNGEILLQYQDVEMNLAITHWSETTGSTVGIQDHTALVGLQYAYQDEYASGGAEIVDGTAILFTTRRTIPTSVVEGHVLDAEDDSPLEGVFVQVDVAGQQVETDATGFYRIENIGPGAHILFATLPRYNEFIAEDVEMAAFDTAVVNVALLHPELELSVDGLEIIQIPGEPMTGTFDILNNGNGPLDCSIDWTPLYEGQLVEPWEEFDRLEVTELTGEAQMQGCVFADGHWYLSGSNGPGSNNLIYQIDREGSFVRSFPQPSTTSIGFFDLAWDGALLYGAQQNSHAIYGFDFDGNIVETVGSPLSPARAIAYDPQTDHFWIADLSSDIYEIDRNENILSQIDNSQQGLLITGLTWRADDPAGMKLYAFSLDDDNNQGLITRIHPETFAFETIAAPAFAEQSFPGGCDITTDWYSTIGTFGGIVRTGGVSELRMYALDHNQSWLDLQPAMTTVPGGETRRVDLVIDADQLGPMTYEILLNVHNGVIDTTATFPVTLIVTDDAPTPGSNLPLAFALYQSYPNPFNPSTTIRYDLPTATRVELIVYNLMGRKVKALADGLEDAGTHAVRFDASALPSGVYFYRIAAGEFASTRKMMLLK